MFPMFPTNGREKDPQFAVTPFTLRESGGPDQKKKHKSTRAQHKAQQKLRLINVLDVNKRNVQLGC